MKHLAIILDGNRRYAQRNLKNRRWGHFEGANRVEDFISWVIDLKIPILTVYALSLKNMKRIGVNYIYDLITDRLNKAAKDKRIHQDKVRLNIIGRKELLPDKLKVAIQGAEKATEKYSKLQLNIAIGYDGKAELVDSFKKIAQDIKQGKLEIEEIDESIIQENLYLPTSPDLIVRTGGEKRLSGFLLWGSSYSEFFFTPTLWPEFTKEELVQVVNEYKKRHRRFGL